MNNDLTIHISSGGIDSGKNPFTVWDSDGWLLPLSENYPIISGHPYLDGLVHVGEVLNEIVFIEKTGLVGEETESDGIGGVNELKDFSFTVSLEVLNVSNLMYLVGREVEVIKVGETRFKGSIISLKRKDKKVVIKARGLLYSSDKNIDASDDDPVVIGGERYVKVPVVEDELGNNWLKLNKERNNILGLYFKEEQEVESGEEPKYTPVTNKFIHRDDGKIYFDPKFGSQFLDAEVHNGYIDVHDPFYVGITQEIPEGVGIVKESENSALLLKDAGVSTPLGTLHMLYNPSEEFIGYISNPIDVNDSFNYEGIKVTCVEKLDRPLYGVSGVQIGYGRKFEFDFVPHPSYFRYEVTDTIESGELIASVAANEYNFVERHFFAGKIFYIYKTSAWGAYEPLLDSILSAPAEDFYPSSAQDFLKAIDNIIVFQRGRIKNQFSFIQTTGMWRARYYLGRYTGVPYASYNEDQELLFPNGEKTVVNKHVTVTSTEPGVGFVNYVRIYVPREITDNYSGQIKITVTASAEAEQHLNLNIKSSDISVVKANNYSRNSVTSTDEENLIHSFDTGVKSYGDFPHPMLVDDGLHVQDYGLIKSFGFRLYPMSEGGDNQTLSLPFKFNLPKFSGILDKVLIYSEGVSKAFNSVPDNDVTFNFFLSLLGADSYFNLSEEELTTVEGVLLNGFKVSDSDRWVEEYFSFIMNLMEEEWFTTGENFPKSYEELQETNFFSGITLGINHVQEFSSIVARYLMGRSRFQNLTLNTLIEVSLSSEQVWARVSESGQDVDLEDYEQIAQINITSPELVCMHEDTIHISEEDTLYSLDVTDPTFSTGVFDSDIDDLVYESVEEAFRVKIGLGLYTVNNEEAGSEQGNFIPISISRKVEKFQSLGDGYYVHFSEGVLTIYKDTEYTNPGNPAVICKKLLVNYLNIPTSRIDSDDFQMSVASREGWNCSLELTSETSVIQVLNQVSKASGLNVIENNDGQISIKPVEIITGIDDDGNLATLLDSDWKVMEHPEREYAGSEYLITELNVNYGEDRTLENLSEIIEDNLEKAKTFLAGEKKVKLKLVPISDAITARFSTGIKTRFHSAPLEKLSVSGEYDPDLKVGNYVSVNGDAGVFLIRKVKEHLIKPIMRLDLVRFPPETFGEVIQEQPDEISTWNEDPESTDIIDEQPNL